MKNNIPIVWELKKSKTVFLICVISLAAVCAVVTAFTINNKDIPAHDVMTAVYEDYYADPEEFDNVYREWQKSYELYLDILLASAKSHEVSGSVDPPAVRHGTIMYDREIYDRFYSSLFRRQTYTEQIDNVIRDARDNISGNPRNSRQIQYNKELIRIYSEAEQNAYIGFEDARGWDTFLENPYPGFFAFVVMIFISAFFLGIEYNSGMQHIIFASKTGRKKVYVYKLTCLFVYSFLLLLVAEAASLLVTDKIIGLSSPYNGIQVFERYTFCPYTVSVIEYCLLSFLSKLICLFLGCVITALTTHLLKKLIYSITCSLFLLSAAYVSVLLTPDKASLSFLLNPLAYLLSSKAFQRYSASGLFVPIDNKILCLSVFALVFGFSLLLLLTFTPDPIVKAPSRRKFKLSFVSHKKSCYPMSLIFFEIQKQMTAKKVLICVSLILIQSLFLLYVYGGEHSEEDRIYLEYMEYLSGEISETKTQYIKSERRRLDDILSSKSQMDERYGSQEISLKEYSDYLSEYEYALSHTDVLNRVGRYDNYLHEISAQKTSPAHFVYSSGYENLFASGNDIMLLLSVFFIASEIYACEYTGETSMCEPIKLIRTAKGGRKRTIIAKYISFCAISAALYIVSTAFRWAVIKSNWLITSFSAPTYSLEALENFDGNILNFIIFYLLLRFLLLLLLSSLILLFSYKRRSGSAAFIVMTTVLFLPYVFAFVGLPFPEILNLTELYNLFL